MADEFPAGLVDFVAGSQIASYQVAEEIGRGGMAVVYRAHDVRLDRWVALKVLAPEFARMTRSGSASSGSRGQPPR